MPVGFLLDDLTRADEDQLLARNLTPSALVILRLLQTAPGNPQITVELRHWSAQLRAVLDQPSGGEAFTAMLTYIELVVRDTSRGATRPGCLARPGRRGGVRNHRTDAPRRRARRGARGSADGQVRPASRERAQDGARGFPRPDAGLDDPRRNRRNPG
jgi:hypothetical protein